MRLFMAALGTVGLMVSGFALAQPRSDGLAGDQARLAAARSQSAAAAVRSQQLERAAASEGNAARKAQQQEAAVAARIQRAEADIGAAQARISIVRSLLEAQRAKLASEQQPIARLLAALQSLARRPTLVSFVQPGSVSDLIHVRAVLGTAMPAVQFRTARLRADVQRTRQLEGSAAIAVRSLGSSRSQLETERLALARLEAEHRLKSRSLGRDALFESDRAIALGEKARDIVDLMDQLGDQNTTRATLETLPGPLPRPPRPGEVATADGGLFWSSKTPPYRLPVNGKIVTGLGEISEAGVRSRGLTIEAESDAAIIAPATGRVAFAGLFRGYGTVVIIDHGSGWTSLIAQLGSASVRVGDRVVQGARIGLAPKGDAPRVTVELRRRDRAIDMTRLVG